MMRGLDLMNLRRHRALRWRRMPRALMSWLSPTRAANDLTSLSDRNLRDIGVSRCQTDFEAAKPFWMP